MPFIHIFFRCIEHIIGVVFVERVVSKVDVTTGEIVCCGFLISLCREASQSFVVNVQSQRVSSSEEHIYPEIKLESVDQQRVLDVFLYDIFVAVEDVLDVACEEDPSPLGQGLRFNYVSTYFSLLHTLVIVPKLTELQGNSPCFGKEVIFLRVVLLHSHQPQSEEILAGENIYSWKMVNLLVQVHAKESVGLYFSVSPPEIPVSDSLLLLDYPPEFLGNFLHDRVLGVPYINHNLFGFWFIPQLCDWDVLGRVVSVDFDRSV